jgi:hypothetical protein
MTAVLASAAQAEIKVTTGASPAWLTGSQVGSHLFTVENGGPILSCGVANFTATAKNGEKEITVVPTYANCVAEIGVEHLIATVTMNDCDYFFHGGAALANGEVDVKCPAGKVIEVHIYKKEPHIAENELCTLTIAEQLNKVGNSFANEAGEKNKVTVTSSVTVNVTRDGSLLCGKAANTAVYSGKTLLEAREDKGGAIKNGTVENLVEGNQVSLTAS